MEFKTFAKGFDTPLLFRFAMFSLTPNPIPKRVFIIMYMFSQAQVLSIFANAALLSLPQTAAWLKPVLEFVYQASSLGDIWDLESNFFLTCTMLSVIALFLLSEVILIFYLIGISLIKKVPSSDFEKYWHVTTVVHFRLLFYPIHYIGTKVLSGTWRPNENVFLYSEIIDRVLQFLIIGGLFWNFLYALGTLLLFSPKIKTKNPLSSHTNLIDFADLTIKTFSPIFWFFGPQTISTSAFFPSLALVYSLFRDWVLFWFLPYYNISVLKLATNLHAFLTYLGFAIVLPLVISYSRIRDNFAFSFVVTLVISPMFISVYAKSLQKILVNILIKPSRMKPYYMLHYWGIWRYYSQRSKVPTSKSYRIDENYMYHNTILTQFLNSQQILCSKASILDENLAELVDQRIFDSYLDLLRISMHKRNSERGLLRACLARQYLKYERLYVLADELVREGIRSSSVVSLKLSFYLIKTKLYKKVIRKERKLLVFEEDRSISGQSEIQRYIELSDRFERLKASIAEQLRSLKKFWETFENHEPNCGVLINTSLRVLQKNEELKQEWVYFKDIADPQFTQPLLIYGSYLSFIQNDFVTGDQLLQEYERLEAKKNEGKRNLVNKLSMKSFTDSVCLTISGSLTSFGKVLDCSSNIEKRLGFSREMIVGQTITLMIPTLFSEHFVRHPYDNNMEARVMNTPREICAVDRQGFLVDCWVYMTLRFFSNQQLCYYLILNPQRTFNRILMIQENGKVLNFSKAFAEDLGFTPKARANLNIFSMCLELREHISNFTKTMNGRRASLAKSCIIPDSAVLGEEFKSVKYSYNRNNRDREKLFTFYIPSKNCSNTIVYNVQVRPSINEEEPFFLIILKKMNTSVVLNSVDFTDEQACSESSLENIFQNHDELDQPGAHEGSKQTIKGDMSQVPVSGNSRTTGTQQEDRGSSNLPLTDRKTTRDILITNRKTRNETSFVDPPKANEGDLGNLNAETFIEDTMNALDRKPKRHRIRVKSKESSGPGNKTPRLCAKDINNYYDRKNRVKAYREIQYILQEKKYKKPVITYSIMFLLTVVVQFLFLVWLSFKAVEASEEAGKLCETLQAAYLRTHWVNLANQEMRFWVGIRVGFFHGWDLGTETDIINITFSKLTEQNKALMKRIRYLSPEIEKLFFEKNINLYQRDSQGKLEFLARDNSFQVIDKIIDHGFLNVYKELEVPSTMTDNIDENSRFIFDNSFDDLLMVSERLIGILEDQIFNRLRTATTDMTVFLSACLVLLGLLILYSIRFVGKINRDFQCFMRVFLLLSDIETKRFQLRISKFYHMIKEDSGKRKLPGPAKMYYELKNVIIPKSSNNNSGKVYRKTPEARSLRQTELRNWISLAQKGFVLAIILGFLILYYLKATGQISVIERHQTNINAALKNIKMESLISAQIHTLVMDNATTTVRHQPILENLGRDLQKMKGVNEIQQRLADGNGQLSARQQEILFNLSCEEAYSPDYLLPETYALENCQSISRGSGRLGLLNLISELSNNIVQYILDFEASGKTKDELSKLYDDLPTSFGYVHDTSMAFFLMSLETTMKDFIILKGELENQRALLAWTALFVSLGLVALLWFFVVRKLIRRVFEPQEVLRLVPPQLIYENVFLSKYVHDIKK